MNLDEGEKYLNDRIESILKSIDIEIEESENKIRSLIMAYFILELGENDEGKPIINPIWNPETYQSLLGENEKVRYITPQTALLLMHRTIEKGQFIDEVVPYEEPMTMPKEDSSSFFINWPYAITCILDMALKRQLIKGVIWKTLIDDEEMELQTSYIEGKLNNRDIKFYKSDVIIPENLKRAIQLYEIRKSKEMTSIWSVDISSKEMDELINLYLVHKDEIEKYYRTSILSILAFLYAISDIALNFHYSDFFKYYIGTIFSKTALLDQISLNINDGGKTRFEEGLEFASNILDVSEELIHFNKLYARFICEIILDKYMTSYKDMPPLEEFINFPNLFYEIEPNCILYLVGLYEIISATIFEKPLLKSGEWLEYKGKEFENYCKTYIQDKCNVKTFSKKIIKNNIVIGDVDVGIFIKPYVFMCECKNYSLNTDLLNGEFYAVLNRIVDAKNGYMGWLSQIDELCNEIDKDTLNQILEDNDENISDYKYIIPIVIVWRPEFILDITKDMLSEDVPRVCTLHELESILNEINKEKKKDITKKEFIITIE